MKRNAIEAGLGDAGDEVVTVGDDDDDEPKAEVPQSEGPLLYSPEPRDDSDVRIVSKIDRSRFHVHSMILKNRCLVFRVMQDFKDEIVIDARGDQLLAFFELLYGEREYATLADVPYGTLLSLLRLANQYGAAPLEQRVVAQFQRLIIDGDVAAYVNIAEKEKKKTYTHSYFDMLVDLQGLATQPKSPIAKLYYDVILPRTVASIHHDGRSRDLTCSSCRVGATKRLNSELPCRSGCIVCTSFFGTRNVSLLRALSPDNRMKLLVALLPTDAAPLFRAALADSE